MVSRNFDLSLDGKGYRGVGGEDADARADHVIFNWFEELKQRVPTQLGIRD